MNRENTSPIRIPANFPIVFHRNTFLWWRSFGRAGFLLTWTKFCLWFYSYLSLPGCNVQKTCLIFFQFTADASTRYHHLRCKIKTLSFWESKFAQCGNDHRYCLALDHLNNFFYLKQLPWMQWSLTSLVVTFSNEQLIPPKSVIPRFPFPDLFTSPPHTLSH